MGQCDSKPETKNISTLPETKTGVVNQFEANQAQQQNLHESFPPQNVQQTPLKVSDVINNDQLKQSQEKYQEEIQKIIDSSYEGATDTTNKNKKIAHGYGKLTLAQGVYEGNFENNTIVGQGTFTDNFGYKYTGQWADYLQEGFGSEVYSNGQKYDGSFERGLKNGFGTFKFSDRSYYEGNWVDNKMEGKGTFVDENLNIYQGEFYNNQFHGLGKFTWKNGNSYDGEYQCGLKDGFGTLTLVSKKKIYEGSWFRNSLSGYVKYVNEAKGHTRFGEWECGKKLSDITEDEFNERKGAFLQKASNSFLRNSQFIAQASNQKPQN